MVEMEGLRRSERAMPEPMAPRPIIEMFRDDMVWVEVEKLVTFSRHFVSRKI
jgi:hypothetical protein